MQKLYEAVLGEKNSAYYLSKFQKFDQQPSGLQSSWNLCAFFFSGFWALYRKMYGWFFVFWGVAIINKITTPKPSAHLHELVISILLFLVPAIVFGIFADSLYYHSVKKKIAKAQLTIKDEAQLVEFLRKKGGVNTWVTWVFFGVPVIVTVVFAAISALQTYKIINKVPTSIEFDFFYLLIVLAIIFAVYSYWFKKETPQKYTNADWKETKPQNPSEKTESIPSSYIYEIISGEMERKEYKKGLATRAFAEANGDKELAKSLYIKFRYAELFSEMELERKEKQRQQQMEVDRIENERTETQQEQSIWTKDLASFGICSEAWAIWIAICMFVYIFTLTSKPENTPTTNTPPATVTSVPAQATPQAVTENPSCIGDCINGQGKYTYTNGETYSGDFKNSMREGHGTYIYADGSKYVGEFKNGEPVEPEMNVSTATQSQPEPTIKYTRPTGAWVSSTDGNTGMSRVTLSDGSVYAGKLKNGQFDGHGTLNYADGTKITGEWKNDRLIQAEATPQDIFKRAIKFYNKGQYAEALPLFLNLAEQGYADAQNNLGTMYANGQGVAKDEAQGVEWYRKAAKQGNANAQYGLGFMYANGQGIAKDEAQAVVWYNKAAEQGNANAQNNLGVMYAKGEGVAKDDAQAVIWFRKAAEQGNANAQYGLGFMYENGQGVAKDEAQAVEWYRKAAEQGSADAQNNLGLMYANGQGIAKDDTQAVIWYRKAAEQGNANAQGNLGVMYENGQGVAKDEAQAVEWYRKAAEQGNATAQLYLGMMYENGRGVAKDNEQAVFWNRKAAEQSNSTAQINLGWYYMNGLLNLPIDYQKAVYWNELGANNGNPEGFNNLGWLYENGLGVKQDYSKAAELYQNAITKGIEQSVSQGRIDEAKSRLTNIKNKINS